MGIASALGGLVGGSLLKGVFGKKPKAAAQAAAVPLPQITARRPSAAGEALARRQGSAADRRTGGAGAESSASGKNRLLGRN